jgi:hypothetical protein
MEFVEFSEAKARVVAVQAKTVVVPIVLEENTQDVT